MGEMEVTEAGTEVSTEAVAEKSEGKAKYYTDSTGARRLKAVKMKEYFTSPECQVLSTSMWRQCKATNCDNPMHESNSTPKRKREVWE